MKKMSIEMWLSFILIQCNSSCLISILVIGSSSFIVHHKDIRGWNYFFNYLFLLNYLKFFFIVGVSTPSFFVSLKTSSLLLPAYVFNLFSTELQTTVIRAKFSTRTLVRFQFLFSGFSTVKKFLWYFKKLFIYQGHY